MKLSHILTILFFSCFLHGGFAEEISYFETSTIDANNLRERWEIIEFKDTIPNDTLFIRETNDGLIHSYYRKISSGVCIDGECRKLDIILYWTVTGRYLGLVLPHGEFLSKTDHDPFKAPDYERLVEVLADPYSILGQYTNEQLTNGGHGVVELGDEIVEASENSEIDGVTSATLPSVKEASVEGAVYTSHTLWMYTYGETQKELRKYTAEHMTDELAAAILKSSDSQDKKWALRNMGTNLLWGEELKQIFFEEIIGQHSALTNQALTVLPDSIVDEANVQSKLMDGFSELGYVYQRNILQKLGKASSLSLNVAADLAHDLPLMNVDIVGRVFAIFEMKNVDDEAVVFYVAELLEHENEVIADKAFEFLGKQEITNSKITQKMEKYSKSKQS